MQLALRGDSNSFDSAPGRVAGSSTVLGQGETQVLDRDSPVVVLCLELQPLEADVVDRERLRPRLTRDYMAHQQVWRVHDDLSLVEDRKRGQPYSRILHREIVAFLEVTISALRDLGSQRLDPDIRDPAR